VVQAERLEALRLTTALQVSGRPARVHSAVHPVTAALRALHGPGLDRQLAPAPAITPGFVPHPGVMALFALACPPVADTLPNLPRTACPPGPSQASGCAPAFVRPVTSSASREPPARSVRPVRRTHRADRRTLPCRKRFACQRRHERPSSPRRRRCIPPSPAQDSVLVASGSTGPSTGHPPQCSRVCAAVPAHPSLFRQAPLPAGGAAPLRTSPCRCRPFQPPLVSRRRGQCVQCAALTALIGGAPGAARRQTPIPPFRNPGSSW
jgi:hypothetical protein